LAAGSGIRCMRDPTRGGVATILNELAKSSGVEMIIDESAVPVCDEANITLRSKNCPADDAIGVINRI
jgi:hydrogenase maturation factor